MNNDYELVAACGPKEGAASIDLVLGGHDHHYEDKVENGVRVLNSAADFKAFTVIDVSGRDSDGSLVSETKRVDITKDIPECEEVVEAISGFEEMVNDSMDCIVGRTKVPLDAQFESIRTKETNVANFFAECMWRATSADITLFPAGMIRADRIVEKGTLLMRDICELLPIADECKVVELTGAQVLKALENGVSAFPNMEGRFPCIHGVRFEFDPLQPAGSRVVPGSAYILDRENRITGKNMKRKNKIHIRGQAVNEAVDKSEDTSKGFQPLDLEETYSLCSIAYLLSGKDGYDCFKGAPVLRDAEECPMLPTVVRNLFTGLRMLKMWDGMTSKPTVVAAATKFKRLARRSVVDPYAISPVVDGRIKNIREDEKVSEE